MPTETVYCDHCTKETTHVVVDSPVAHEARGDYYACLECGGETKRLYENCKRLTTPIRLTPESALAIKVKSMFDSK